MSITNYLKETRSELKHVSWPTRRQAVVFSTLVVGISLVTAFFLGIFDFIFTAILKTIIGS
ncbi:preprotein translocase subunit SecE [Candidatus Kaiserbacteria bacterium RIFCSPHIGHO2_01_FULL_49_13]|uniref:Protein translocase subunit SecE n=1 Tax=Candidatus Kaiserbacteria bacterium RIFCSPHIGHO2_01_FULL_49_13 TaxID=1798477 RepID=A0A1F6CE94_9BACT|nr:MAG: preprotein translocase subunit SecE [Candidatus Kaiserbacteria bacterium RIFCSPHIGHO2_01_FULL_49_13]